MKLTVLMAASALFLSGCSAASDVATAPKTTATNTIEACTQQGGKLQQVGRAQTWQCILQFTDAGKPCTDGSQCQGNCMAKPDEDVRATASAIGICAANSDRFGCQSTITNGVASPVRCVD